MAQQDFERFKREIREWLDSHPEEYDRFVAEVNDKSAIGLYKVFNVGMRHCAQTDAQVSGGMSWRPCRRTEDSRLCGRYQYCKIVGR